MQAWRKYVTAPAANVFAYLAPADPVDPPSPQPAPLPDGYQPVEEDAGEEALSESEAPQPPAPGYGPTQPADAAPKKKKPKKKKNTQNNAAKRADDPASNYVIAEHVPPALNGHHKLAASAYFTEDAEPVVIPQGKPLTAALPIAAPVMPDFSMQLKAQEAVRPREGFNANWNARFQALVEGSEQDEQAKLKKFEKLSALWREFMHTAKSCGKIIISERQMPNERRTIPAVALGGCAGGVKYIYHGILFKFAIDDHHLYGGDHFAQKAAGHELKGLMRYFMQPGLHVPLMALVDYKGHRLIASSILPIRPGDTGTIRYGSPDGGRTVYATDPELMDRMEQAGRRLNLKGHMAGQTKGDRKFLYSPCDIEGHLGDDKRFYVIDLARVFPPAAEPSVRKTYLYRLLRPEFVKSYRTPLSSDAFSQFGGPDNVAEGHDKEVQEATDFLLTFKIPQFAKWLDEQAFKNGDDFQITELIHREGINVRYLGRVRTNLRSASWRTRLLLEMVARVMKNDLRMRMRTLGESLGENPFAETKFTKLLLRQFNLPLQSDAESKTWWIELRTHLAETFPHSLTPEETEPTFDLKSQIQFEDLFRRLQYLTGVRFSKQSLRELAGSSTTFRLVAPDLKKLSARVKGLNVLALAEGNWLSIQSRKDVSQFGSDRLFRLAIRKFEAAIRSTPDNLDVLNQFAHSLVCHALKAHTPDSVPYLTLALERYAMAGNFQRLLELGRELQKVQKSWWQDRDNLIALAIRCYQVVNRAPNLPAGLTAESCENWGALLVKQARRFVDDKRYEEAGEKYRQMLVSLPQHKTLGRWALELDNLRLAAVVELLRERSVVQAIDAASVYKRELITEELLLSIATNCRQLSAVALRQCVNVRGAAIAKLSQYCALSRLDLTDCRQITDVDMAAALQSSMTAVVLTGCVQLSTATVRSLVEKTPALQELSLRGCVLIDDATPPLFRLLKKLSILDISQCSALTFGSLGELGQFVPGAEILRLAEVKGGGEGTLVSIGKNCPRLRVLNIPSFPASLGYVLHFITDGCPLLESLNIGEVVDTRDPSLERICRLSRLNELSLHSCEKLTDAGLKNLLRVAPLRSLDISFCYRISSETAGALLRVHSTLHTLSMINCHNIDDASLSQLSSCTSLHSLMLGGCGTPAVRLKDAAALSIASHGRLLRSLDLSESEITDEGIARIAERCTHLTSLQLNKCKFLTDIGLRRIGASCHALRLLELRECLCISSVACLPTGCPNLDVLDLYGDENISDNTVQLLHSLALLRWLNLQRVKKLTDASLENLKRGCPSLRVLVLGFNKVTDEAVEGLKRGRPGLRLHLDGYKNQNRNHGEADM